MTCSYKAKPAVDIFWIYNISGDPDTSIIDIHNYVIDNNPYTITKSSLTWNINNEDKRKTVSGIYTCKANNTFGSGSSNMILDVQCKCMSSYLLS